MAVEHWKVFSIHVGSDDLLAHAVYSKLHNVKNSCCYLLKASHIIRSEELMAIIIEGSVTSSHQCPSLSEFSAVALKSAFELLGRPCNGLGSLLIFKLMRFIETVDDISA